MRRIALISFIFFLGGLYISACSGTMEIIFKKNPEQDTPVPSPSPLPSTEPPECTTNCNTPTPTPAAPCPVETPTLSNHFYVDPVKGSDSCSGRTVNNAFKTLEKARDEVRKVNGDMTGHLVVDLLPGLYFLKDTFALNQADSGTNGFSIIYQGADASSVIISGGQVLTKGIWQLHDAAKGIYKASIGTTSFRQLYVNGQRATRARSPLNSYGSTQTASGYTLSGISLEGWQNIGDIEVVSLSQWKSFRCKVNQASGSDISIKEPCWTRSHSLSGQAIEGVSWLENAYELLDEKGEWYHNRQEGVLYYKPLDGENIQQVSVVIPSTETLISIHGASSQPAKNIIFTNMTFSYTNWPEPDNDTGYIPIQTGYFYKLISGFNVTNKISAAVHLEHSSGVEILDSNFFYLGGSAITIDNQSNGNRVARNTIRGISGNGIYIGDDQPSLLADGNQVVNNRISYTGVEFFDSAGITVGYTTNTLVGNNEVAYLPYTGISLGGLDDNTAATGAGNNIVRANHIHDVMNFLADGGGVYTRSRQDGTIIEQNYIHHVYGGSGPPLHSWNHGVYLDNASQYITVRDNVFNNISLNNIWQQNDVPPFAENNILSNNDTQNSEIIANAGPR